MTLLLVAFLAWCSGAVCGALMVSLHSARQPSISLQTGSHPAFSALHLAPQPHEKAIERAEKTLEEAEKPREERAVFVPSHETRRQRRLLENSPVSALRKAKEEAEA